MRLAKLKIIVNNQSIYGYFPPNHIYLIDSFDVDGGKVKTKIGLNVIGEEGDYSYPVDMPIELAVDEINAAMRDELITME